MKAHPLLLEDQRDAAHLHNGNEVFVPRFGSVDIRAECSSKEPLSSLWEPPHCTTGEHFRQPESRGRIGFKRFSSAPPQVKLGMG